MAANTKRIVAWLNLAVTFNVHMVQKVVQLFKGKTDPVEKFLNQFKDDRITLLTPSERDQFGNFFQCVNCGTCDSHCQIVASGAHPHFPGPSLLVAAASRSFPDQIFAQDAAHGCLLCKQCEQFCPQHIPIREVSLHIRRTALRIDSNSLPDRLKRAIVSLERTGNVFGKTEVPFQLPGKTVFFRGCTLAHKLPEEVERHRTLLKKLGIETTLIEEICCGHVHSEAGLSNSDTFIEKNIQNFKRANAEQVIIACPSCYMRLKAPVEAQTMIKVRFLIDVITELQTLPQLPDTLAIYQGCKLDRFFAPDRDWRQSLKLVGIDPEKTLYIGEPVPCCGAGGAVAISAPEAANKLAKAILKEAKDKKVTHLLTLCPTSFHMLHRNRAADDPMIVSLADLLS